MASSSNALPPATCMMNDIMPHQVNKGMPGGTAGSVHHDAKPTDKYAATVYELFGERGMQLSKNYTMCVQPSL